MNWTPCSYVKCRSRQPGIFTPIIRFYAKDVPKSLMPPGHAVVSGVMLCNNCAQTANVHEIVSDRRWQEICTHLSVAGATPPDRDSIELLLGTPKNQKMLGS